MRIQRTKWYVHVGGNLLNLLIMLIFSILLIAGVIIAFVVRGQSKNRPAIQKNLLLLSLCISILLFIYCVLSLTVPSIGYTKSTIGNLILSVMIFITAFVVYKKRYTSKG